MLDSSQPTNGLATRDRGRNKSGEDEEYEVIKIVATMVRASQEVKIKKNDG